MPNDLAYIGSSSINRELETRTPRAYQPIMTLADAVVAAPVVIASGALFWGGGGYGRSDVFHGGNFLPATVVYRSEQCIYTGEVKDCVSPRTLVQD